jgi:hypothetical protein
VDQDSSDLETADKALAEKLHKLLAHEDRITAKETAAPSSLVELGYRPHPLSPIAAAEWEKAQDLRRKFKEQFDKAAHIDAGEDDGLLKDDEPYGADTDDREEASFLEVPKDTRAELKEWSAKLQAALWQAAFLEVAPEPGEMADWKHKLELAATGDHEGDVVTCNGEEDAFVKMVQKDDVKTVCETGFNRGFTSLLWLVANKDVRVFSFDLGLHATVQKGTAFLKSNFVDAKGSPRLTLTLGDSTKTIPEFIASHPDVKCDLVLVDGGHEASVAQADLRNFKELARPGATVIMDDTPCNAAWCVGPTKAWGEAVSTGLVTGSTGTVCSADRGFSFGTY